MKRLLLITAACLTAALPAFAQDKPIVLKLAHIYAAGTVWAVAAEDYAKGVESSTGGKVKIQIAGGGSTGDYPQAIEALKIGTNHIVLQSIGTLDRYNALAGVEAYPYMIRDLDHFKKVYYGPAGAEFAEELAKKTGFRIVGAAYRGFRWMTANKPIKSIDDVKGLKMRVPPLKMYRMTWDLLGANPTPINATELYTSLQQGVVDGQENPLETIDNSKWYEVQKYAIDTRHTVGAMTWIFSDAWFKSQPPAVQKALKEEGERSMLAAGQRVADMEGTLRKKFEGHGMTFLQPDLAPFRARLEPMIKEFPALEPWVHKFQAVK